VCWCFTTGRKKFIVWQSPSFLRLSALVTWERTCMPQLAFESTFSNVAVTGIVTFTSQVLQRNWMSSVLTPHVFRWFGAATGVCSRAVREECYILSVLRTAKAILRCDGRVLVGLSVSCHPLAAAASLFYS
jgi:hypothetical protein